MMLRVYRVKERRVLGRERRGLGLLFYDFLQGHSPQAIFLKMSVKAAGS